MRGGTMWTTPLVCASLLGVVASATAIRRSTPLGPIRSVHDPQVPPLYPIGVKNESFARPAGQLFNINGNVSYFAGTNAWWLGHLTKNEDVDKALQEIVDTKYKIVRVWAFGDVVRSLPAADAVDPDRVWYQQHPTDANGTALINYGADGLQRLDYVVSAAERVGLKLVLPFVNNWPDLGGVQAYAEAYGPQTIFEDGSRAQRAYRAYVRVLVERYRASPAVFAWQLGNEPRCEGCDTAVIYRWASNTSAYIKSLDPHHMVTLGDEGWFGSDAGYKDMDGSSSLAYESHGGVDFFGNLNISTLDYGTFHLYPSQWGYSNLWGNHWIRQHADAGDRHKKPVVLEEYGSPNHTNRATILLPWQQTVLNTSIAADQVWQFGPANLSLDAATFGDEYSVYFDQADFESVGMKHAQAMVDKPVGT
ncbi:glycoside hydrolase family 5 protein [Niveomyces insectorum RCEF 264]|uniref:mannan endo-1,4-beta-mannosidase n=1 Tax=Niveomyces insectorum RCEF 264 TaxID=1081102 RepID=A0A162LAP6_9HYPO|nr:glycoside hydrolase family 5 protein [Niveomyces insectorum RCEF 264]